MPPATFGDPATLFQLAAQLEVAARELNTDPETSHSSGPPGLVCHLLVWSLERVRATRRACRARSAARPWREPAITARHALRSDVVFERWRMQRQLRRVPELSSTTLEGSVARVTGIVRVLDESMIAPRSGRRCVGYRITLRFAGRETVGGRFESSELRPFAIERAGDLVAIESTEARFALPSVPPTPPLDREEWQTFRQERGLYQRTLALGAIREAVIEVGMTVSVAGLVTIVTDPNPPSRELGFREEAPRSVKLIGDLDHPLLIGSAIGEG